ncbi:hypothetical protein AALO_G00264910 [Alosa alosa]|uniref:Uncharacterized protein n=1 Tax=Alosa alosa TaxID=278164 RepID=A0AAV6FL67_9TELE|nr:hypothetical protein AALO_G00264910 [Alosa alosa]
MPLNLPLKIRTEGVPFRKTRLALPLRPGPVSAIAESSRIPLPPPCCQPVRNSRTRHLPASVQNVSRGGEEASLDILVSSKAH